MLTPRSNKGFPQGLLPAELRSRKLVTQAVALMCWDIGLVQMVGLMKLLTGPPIPSRAGPCVWGGGLVHMVPRVDRA